MPKNFVTRQISGKQLTNLENRKPQPSIFAQQPVFQPIPTQQRQPNGLPNMLIEPRDISREKPVIAHVKSQRVRTEQATFVTDKLTLPTTSTYCEKSKEEGSPRLRFRPMISKQNITSNAEIIVAPTDPRLKCEESLNALGLRRRNPQSIPNNTSNINHNRETLTITQVSTNYNATTLHKLSGTLSDLEAVQNSSEHSKGNYHEQIVERTQLSIKY